MTATTPGCPPCADGLKCVNPTDCKSMICTNGICGSTPDLASSPQDLVSTGDLQ
jgi:hypothetical protein